MTLINGGTIIADGSNPLVIDTGANIVTNSGTLQSTGSGGLIICSDLANSGLLWGDGGNITVHGSISGAGSVIIDGSAVVEVTGADSNSVTFDSATGELILDHSAAFTGTIFGFTGDGKLKGSDLIDLRDISFSSIEQSTYANGVLTVSDGVHTAHLSFDGSYQLANFKFVNDGEGGTTVYDPPVISKTAPAHDASTTYISASASVSNTSVTTANEADSTTASVDPAATDTISPDSATFFKDTIANFKADMAKVAQSFSDQIQHILDTAHDGKGNAAGAAVLDALSGTGTKPADRLASTADAKSGFDSGKVTAFDYNSTWHNSANGMLNGSNDAFVFKPNLGNDLSAHSNLASDNISTDHMLGADLQHLLDTSHHDLVINPVIGADANAVLHDMLKNQLQHSSDFHFA